MVPGSPGRIGRGNRGSLSVEACLIVPLILLVLFWLVNVAFLLYWQAALQSIAAQAVEAAQAGWDNPSKEIGSGRLAGSGQLGDGGLYWNLRDRRGALKAESLRRWTLDRIERDPLMKLFAGPAGDGRVTVSVETGGLGFLRRSITVRITDRRETLFSPLRRPLSLAADPAVRVMSRGTLQDPAELIRNLDFGLELYAQAARDAAPGTLINRLEEIRTKCIDLLE